MQFRIWQTMQYTIVIIVHPATAHISRSSNSRPTGTTTDDFSLHMINCHIWHLLSMLPATADKALGRAHEPDQREGYHVNKMYKTIFDEINSIGEDTGILPQIIIVDHVDGKNLECKEEFERYIRCNWRNDTGLI